MGRAAEGGRWDAQRFAAPLAFVAAVSYATFVLEHALSPDLDVINGYVSELSARDQPFHGVYSGGDFVTGVLAIAVAGVALVVERRGWAVAGWTFLALFGLGAIGDAVFPLDCAPSLDTGCALRERAGTLSFSHSFHAVTSSLVTIFGVTAMLALSIAARHYGRWPVLARWGLWIGVTEIVLALGTLAAMMAGDWLGIVQRAQILVLCGGLLAIGCALHMDGRAAR